MIKASTNNLNTGTTQAGGEPQAFRETATDAVEIGSRSKPRRLVRSNSAPSSLGSELQKKKEAGDSSSAPAPPKTKKLKLSPVKPDIIDLLSNGHPRHQFISRVSNQDFIRLASSSNESVIYMFGQRHTVRLVNYLEPGTIIPSKKRPCH